MNIFYLLIGASLVAALVFLAAFIWAVKSGQFEDNYTPAVRILFDDDTPKEKKEPESESTEQQKEQEVQEVQKKIL